MEDIVHIFPAETVILQAKTVPLRGWDNNYVLYVFRNYKIKGPALKNWRTINYGKHFVASLDRLIS